MNQEIKEACKYCTYYRELKDYIQKIYIKLYIQIENI